VKYCDSYFEIILSETRDKVMIRVNSDGTVIPEKESERIFEVFYQSKNIESKGAGIGLTYSRSLALLQNGALYLDTKVRDVNSFVLELPKTGVANEDESVSAFVEKELIPRDKPCIMVVEDNPSMREAIREAMTQEYDVLVAENGEDAMEKLTDNVVDLVISDIMMPVMDGCELCNAIKSVSDISHIPVILLTAVVGTETRIETLEVGADGYIEKPFPIELLLSNISNLFKNKEISYRQFMNKPLTHYSSVTTNKVDQEYMDKVHEFIMSHIAETDLNIENLTIQLGTSKSSLYRKLKANTGLSINEYIRLCRLKQAAELLSSQKYKINEVAFMTGFSSPSYFATCFLKQFNLTPSEFVKNLGE
jgi:DNA-binding response OmpR family regulator